MLDPHAMKAFNRVIHVTAALLLAGSAYACKSDAEKREDKVDEAREKVIEKTENVQQQEKDMAQAKADLVNARADFLTTVDARLQDLDARIVASKTNAAIDQGRIATLRAEATALRSKAADETQPYAADMKATFDRIMSDIDAELNRR